jgi:hypothetical protein
MSSPLSSPEPRPPLPGEPGYESFGEPSRRETSELPKGRGTSMRDFADVAAKYAAEGKPIVEKRPSKKSGHVSMRLVPGFWLRSAKPSAWLKAVVWKPNGRTSAPMIQRARAREHRARPVRSNRGGRRTDRPHLSSDDDDPDLDAVAEATV